MPVAESFELALGPGVHNPVLHASPCRLGLLLSLVPVGLDLRDEGLRACLGGLLGLDTLLPKIVAESLGVPLGVRTDNVGIPVLLDKLLEVLPIGRSWVRDIVVREPTLEFGLMPLVVS